MLMSLELLVVLLLILAAEFVNGWTDAPNAIATVVGTRALSPRGALAMASVFNLLGVLSGTAVAATIGKDIIDPSAVTLTTVGGASEGTARGNTPELSRKTGSETVRGTS
jgi:PiT family inorganic phosphate transporter